MRRKYLAAALLVVCAALAAAQSKKFKPGFNLFSREQDIQMGLEAAQQVERHMLVVRDPAVQEYITRIGKSLAAQAEGEPWPFTFKVVQDESINAFSLPGGPMFIHTGLIKAAENEAQLAGVMAHEMSHVIMRHGTNNVSKAQMIQLPAMLAGALASNGSMIGLLEQLGIQIGAGGVLNKMSRGAERDADLLGANLMQRAGYNPIEMARFFEKLQGSATNPSAISKLAGAFTTDHPDPGDRVKTVEKEITTMPSHASYDASAGDFNAIRSRVVNLPPPSKQGLVTSADLADMLPSSNFRTHQTSILRIDYPDNWQVFGDANAPSSTIAPRKGIVQAANGGSNVAYGVMLTLAHPSLGDTVDLNRDTQDLLKRFSALNPSMKIKTQPQAGLVDGRNAYMTQVTSDSSFPGQREVSVIVTVDRGDSMFYSVFIAPDTQLSKTEPTFKKMLNSIRFIN